MKNLRWIGKEDTVVRKEFAGAKIAVKKGETIEVSDEMAKSHLGGAYRKQFEVVEKNITKAVVKPERVAKAKK